ncbi:hypothetical protein [Cellulomonas fimi]|uniref:Uncharacterized protein n=1 Tax=Cellulomonas fimi (strain ATCC 484 / DSM 20113 / JCM 1341 / CCUG 24087 / LMG 16345 / NBRC 15513 / NCIMB 8980 / NCTC 7547 / NRS-133) TaxID=590998 RepID=F4H2E4_CELFA|nr:hypothetical protein [Cellulomonas fimi]AEE47564.1 hypothetical protein Celf_3452 [Cellulomonas fimi ATCC 484]NNH07927.1 hypothetical protein [Cellulomonas fimi]VEH36544.1 Uncharacterised protein [Cellulomonas fimi]
MSEDDTRYDLPTPTGVVPGGAPDPVRDTAPHAEPAPHEVDADGDGYVDDAPVVYPVPGAQGAVPPPPVRPTQE